MRSPNLQTIPKTPLILDCLVPKPGWKFVELDFTALEPTVLASFSKDATLKEVYASGRDHDVYLYFAQFIHPDQEVKEALRAAYKSDAEVLGELKRRFKKERNLIKDVFLAFGYGAQAPRLMAQFKSAGFSTTLEQCQQIFVNYWELLRDVKKFENSLKREWIDRGGFILDGFSLPRCIPERDVRSVLNRFVQATGHGVLLKYLFLISKLRKERGVEMIPVVPDWHDETVFQTPDPEAATLVFKDALALLNKELTENTGHIPFKGGVEIATNFTQFKIGG